MMEREEGCGRWLMANAGVVGVETRLFRGERSEARWRLERRVVRKASGCQRRRRFQGGGHVRSKAVLEREETCVGLLELDRKPGILSPKALTFSKSQSVRISISDTFIVGNCN